MKGMKTIAIGLCAAMLMTGCNNMSKGTAIGAGGGAILGAVVGKLAGNMAVGAAVGTAVGAGAGALIGKHMDKVKAQSEAVQNAQVESVTEFANNVLKVNTDCDVAIQGYTDNQGWKNSTAEQSAQKNLTLSQQRADAVSTYLKSLGVSATQIRAVDGFGEANPVADNSTKAGQQQNRRVEVYLYASQAMIQAAEAGTLQ